MTRAVVRMTIDDAEHLSPERRAEIAASYGPAEREARTRGVPVLGAGAIYPVEESAFVVPPFPIPAHWPRCYGLDVGWGTTAAVWLSEDRDTGIRYAYAEYARGEAVPLLHAQAIKLRGDWIRGAIDPASRGASQADGQRLFDSYAQQGLHLVQAINAVEAGIYGLWSRLETGQMKVFSTLSGLLDEFRTYHRDAETGKVVKEHDHRLDAWRYANSTFDAAARSKPVEMAALVSSGPADSRAGY
jgi:hypothetical protein